MDKKLLIKKLTLKVKKITGRNNSGKIVLRHRGGGVKKKFRLIDFNRFFFNIPMIPLRIDYDPYRTSFICLVFYINGFFSYILCPEILKTIKTNTFFIFSFFSEIKNGNSLPLKNIPVGTVIHNIELYAGRGSVLARAAGTFGQILSKGFLNDAFILIKLKSGEEYLLNENCLASIGVVSNSKHHLRIIRKAGISRLKNKRPKVRGVAMNPVDHPHGGGEGKTSGGRPSVSFKGKLTKGVPTRKKQRKNIYIYKPRKKK